jgi:GxxExxY protein
LKVYYQSRVVVGEYIADLVVEDKVIIELKAIETLKKVHFAQLMHYLKTTNFKLGLISNFGNSKLEFHRVILERGR